MKRIFVISLLFLILFIGSCKDKDRNEPNDSFNQAKKIKLNKKIKMSVFPKRDIDFFKFSVKDPGMIHIEYDIEKPTNIKLIATLYDDDTNIIANSVKIPFKKTLPKGDYFLSIKDDLNDEESEKTFSIIFNFFKVALDKFEPNNKLEEARVIKINNSLKINIFPKGDKEAFKIQSPNAGYLKFSYDENKPIDIKLMLNFYNLDGELLKGPLSLPVEIPIAEGDFAFILFDENDNSESEDLFSVKIEFEPIVLDKFEPNNSFSESKEITFGKFNKINLFPAGDMDYFKFTLKENSLIEILKKFGPDKAKIDVKTNIYDNFGNLIVNNKSIPFEVELAAGKYYIQFLNKDVTGVYPDIFELKLNVLR